MIQGKLVTLRLARLEDRRSVYDWMAQSNITSDMLGPPTFPDVPASSWEDFLDDYQSYFFEGPPSADGRCFIIEYDHLPVGHINYNDLEDEGRQVELDIWMADRKFTGKGYGPDAIHALCDFLHQHFGCTRFIMAPSARNPKAIKAYEKAGFSALPEWPKGFVGDYDDAVVMMRYISP